MGKIKKKGKAGQAKNYITRTQAVRKLQVTLPDFRRLCIFKNIFPREPRNLKKANKSATHSTTFYYTKDIQYLLHEPLLAKFREQKALSKKIARSLGRNEIQNAARLEKNHTPKIKLDHIIRERYPTFIDAIRDLDDALSLLFLFANLPSTATVPPKVISKCQRLCHEFEHYLITTNSLRKSFLSIKGIYYQATIQGQDVMWLVPYRFVQRVTQDVDYRIMGTFVEFYCTLLGFVNFRLYTSIGLVYPPKFDITSDERGAELAAFTLEGKKLDLPIQAGESQKAVSNGHAQNGNTEDIQKRLNDIAAQEDPEANENTQTEIEELEDNEAIDKFETTTAEADILPQPELSSNEAANLFSNMTIFISREAPRHPVEFLLRSFGCKRIAWDAVLGDGAFTNNELDARVTHQVVDRPPVSQSTSDVSNGLDHTDDTHSQRVRPGHFVPGRIYVQPQWIWDCVNEGKLLRSDLYAPGATLPPHLSPWMKPTKGQYDPRASLADQEAKGEADDQGSSSEEEELEEAALDEPKLISAEDDSDAGGMDIAPSEDDEEEDEDDVRMSDQNDFAGFERDESVALASGDEGDDEEARRQKELEAEAAGLSFPAANGITKTLKKSKAKTERLAREKREEEELERQKMMMPRKKRKLYEKMQYSNNKKDAEAEKLRKKRRKLEQEKRQAA